MRTVIFDLDGTLADTSGDLIDAANRCFRGLGLGDLLTYGADAGTAMRGGKAMLRLGFSRVDGFAEDEVERQYPILLAYYGAQLDRHTRLFDGAAGAVAELGRRGYRLGICTNKPAGLAETLMQRLDLRAPFASLIGADSLPVRKPDPAPYRAAVAGAGGIVEQSILIGDTVTDRETARAAGAPCILVTFGPDGPSVADLGPEALLDHFDDLPDLVATMIGRPDG